MSDLSQIVKAYDVRGTVPDQWDERVAEALGAAFTQLLNSTDEPGDAVVVGYDMRATSPGLAAAFAAGVRAEGRSVIEIGLASTDLLYYASGSLDLPGAMFTASHNPAQYNGIKMCRSGARPIGQESGLAEIRERAQALLDSGDARPAGAPTRPAERRDLLPDYAGYLRKLVDLSGIRPLKVVVDAGNGMGGFTVPTVLGDAALSPLPLEIVPLYFELDGSFPNHEANPLDPANLVDLQRAVVEHGADIGLAFDGDADRCFVVDERGEPVSPSAITALVAARELAKHPGSTVIHGLITSSAVAEIIREHGGQPVVARVGHSFIKAEMARTNAVFGGEHSAHYYFRDFWFADTGMLAAMHTLAALGEQSLPLSVLAGEYERYIASGEINSTVADQAAAVAEVRAAYPDAVADEMDGLTLRFPDGAWFNLRASNTEPLLRLNVEAPTRDRMVSLRDDVLDRVRR
ncbi:phosphomannomutase/phosphoglucomutase [Micromonospora saelicesensis]|uniref:Phosphomannomutase n=1 Tax=Micromonospora saelicesensis TaxID=285676 RepID=A0A1C4U5C0_9ACTN|nr:phosphomannomutase/phosphoglucomutase [Micromonospora saelicesensis]RAN95264.1 Phosphomannomutase [Micromonospora saelicesensis]RAO26660.1 Phosphomannomutase [Micromonospora saelicesensis]RAO40155.1 Phosphomannomutase [Micromonospora saelicesensis]RAO43986.1 Phosphomannomutase [Micromonospora saelicesensis]RAO58162.1 Phosphomannomutase [Micromonospora saelicesensis]